MEIVELYNEIDKTTLKNASIKSKVKEYFYNAKNDYYGILEIKREMKDVYDEMQYVKALHLVNEDYSNETFNPNFVNTTLNNAMRRLELEEKMKQLLIAKANLEKALRERYANLVDIINLLNNKNYATALKMRFVESRTINDIADELGISYDVAKQSVLRGLTTLSKIFEKNI